MQPSQAVFGHSVGLSKKAVWVSSSSAMAERGYTLMGHSAGWCKRIPGVPGCAVSGGIHPLYIHCIDPRVKKKKSKQITSVKNPILRKSDELLFSASFIGALLDIKQRRQFSWNVCSVLESWMPVKLTVFFQNHP